jgi:hypothetical protein
MGIAIIRRVADNQGQPRADRGIYIYPPVCPPLLDKLSARGGHLSALALKGTGVSFADILSAMRLTHFKHFVRYASDSF